MVPRCAGRAERGPHTDVDLAYGALATYVSDHALGVEGPVREYYLIGPHETRDEGQWRTEIGWPIFHTGQTDNRASRRGGTS
jgi:effector-binding domain-containing protein